MALQQDVAPTLKASPSGWIWAKSISVNQSTEVRISVPGASPLDKAFETFHGTVNQLAQFFRFPAQGSHSELAKLLWLVRLRWLAISLFFILSGPALMIGVLTRDTIPMYLGIVGVLLLFNLLTQLTLSEKNQPISPLWICFQMAFDLVMLTSLLFLTGGFGNPFVALFLLNASLGGLLIAGRLSWPFLVLNHTFLAALQFQFAMNHPEEWSGHLFSTFAIYHFFIFSFWIVMRSLGAHLERQFDRQAQAQVFMERQDRLRAIGSLAAGFSHEFASPLNSAKIRLERMLRKDQSEDLLEALSAVHACEEVVHQMNSSQLDSRDFQFKKVIVADLLRDVVETWSEQHPTTTTRIEILDSSSGFLPPVNFAQVVLNLLDNAGEAAPGKEIEVQLSGTNERFLLCFSDKGQGFSEAILRRLGEPFVTTKTNGTGLGLYVSQLFCHSLGGTFQVASNPGQGASIRLEWPKAGGIQ